MGLQKDSPSQSRLIFRLKWDGCAVFLAIFTLLFTLLFNTPRDLSAAGGTLEGILWQFVVSFGYAYALFALISLSRSALILLLPLLTVLSAAAAYFTNTFGVRITENTMALLFETSIDEARGMVGIEAWLWAAAGLTMSIVAVACILRLRKRCSPAFRLVTAAVTALILLFSPRPHAMRGLHMSLLPVSIFANTNVYFREKGMLMKLAGKRSNIGEVGFKAAGDEGILVVMIIGEAVRSANFHFNGYERQTSPYLDTVDLISYRDVYSCETNTRYSVPCLMTRGTEEDLELPYRETSFVSVFRKLGYETAWVSNQGRFWSGSLVQRKFTIAATSAIAQEAETVLFLNKTGDVDFEDVRDENLVGPFKDALAEPGKSQLVVLHMAGSHWYYDAHYPESFRKFTPTCGSHNPNRCTPEEMTNSYDNSLLYTDYVVSRILEPLKGRKAVVLYVSDHGEALGENEKYLHYRGSFDPNMRNAATFFWLSEQFVAAYPERVEALKSNRGRRLSHDNIFHTILDCTGISGPLVDPEMSMCRPNTRERPRDGNGNGRARRGDPLLF